jgi:heme A synthase
LSEQDSSLTGNTAETLTDARPFWAIGHLLNTFTLLVFLALTAWYASGDRTLSIDGRTKQVVLIALGVIAILFVGTSGSVAALSHMLFPSQSLTEGFAQDFSAGSNTLLRLRLSHPIISILTSVYLIFLAGWLRSASDGNPDVTRWSNYLSILVLIQIAFGAATLLTLAPIVMQIGHLLLADLIWISLVLLSPQTFLVKAYAPFLTAPDKIISETCNSSAFSSTPVFSGVA